MLRHLLLPTKRLFRENTYNESNESLENCTGFYNEYILKRALDFARNIQWNRFLFSTQRLSLCKFCRYRVKI